MIGDDVGDTRNSKGKWKHGELSPDYQPAPDYESPFMRQIEKPYSEWTKKQREWFDKNVWGSPRGRKAEQIHNEVYRALEIARLSDTALTYRQILMQVFNLKPEAFKDYHKKTGVSSGEYKRQQLIRAYQRRRSAQRLPDPPQD